MLLTRYAPLRRSPPKYCYLALPLDLHVLSLPLAFILSQDQTLHCIFLIFPARPRISSINSKRITLRSDFNRVKIGTCLYLFIPSFQSSSPLFPKRDCKGTHFFFSSKFFSKNFHKIFGATPNRPQKDHSERLQVILFGTATRLSPSSLRYWH